jgi:formylglycine-generating enzyme required for sulfatase activity
MPKLFISYRRDDSEAITGRIYDRLSSHFGREAVFMDIDTIPYGVDFREHLSQAVGQCAVLLAVIGENWLDIRFNDGSRSGQRRLDDPADFVRIEIESALARNIPVIPVLVGKVNMPSEGELPEGLLRRLPYRNAAEVRSGREFHDQVGRLIRGIEYLLQPRDRELERQQAEEQPRPPVPTVRKERQAGEVVANGLGMQFAWCPPGSFLMGRPAGEKGDRDEIPQHRVTLTQGFYLGIRPVTQAQWQAVMGSNPSHFKGDNRPVENVSWEDCQEFCRKLGAKEGKRYRLPTEAEWEYACRAGTTSEYHTGNREEALKRAGWYGSNSGSQTHPVGQKEANAWGLFDMHGNVWEWCLDGKHTYTSGDITDPQGPNDKDDARVLRGGSWGDDPSGCRAAYRGHTAPSARNLNFGCRVVLCLD